MKKIWSMTGVGLFWLTWLGLFIYLYRTRRTRIIVISPDNCVLLEKGWLSAGQWILPGGGLHKGEEGKSGAIREMEEETGVKLTPDQLLPLGEGRAREYGLRFSYAVYAVRLPSKPDIQRRSGELTDVIWLPLTELHGLSPLTKRLLAEWSSRGDLLK